MQTFVQTRLEIEDDNPKVLKKTLNALIKDTDKVKIKMSSIQKFQKFRKQEMKKIHGTHGGKQDKQYKKNINLLVINITANDITSLRATVNTLLRLIKMLKELDRMCAK